MFSTASPALPISLTLFLSIVGPTTAWLPSVHRQLLTRDGTDLFNLSSSSSQDPLSPRSLPSTTPIRGVNLGSLFILENWMSSTVMGSWGCNTKSEFDCVSSLPSQADANAKWAEHWGSWVTQADFQRMREYGLNTVRIPVGYWFLENLVDRNSEHFPEGGEAYLDQVVDWAREEGLYTIVVLHGAPGAQVTDAFMGQLNPDPGFYGEYNYDRSAEWLEWMTEKIHTDEKYSAVGMLEVVNEPERTFDTKDPDAERNAGNMIKVSLKSSVSYCRVNTY
jgi:glucan endo-1,6-beta-glucosidase